MTSKLPDTIALIGCGKTKHKIACKAKDLYTGPLFTACRKWAERFADQWWIASAKHLILEPDKIIEPYDTSMSNLAADARRWRARQIQQHFHSRWVSCCQFGKSKSGFVVATRKPRVVLLAGKNYLTGFRELRDRQNDRYCFETPLEGLGVGQQLAWLKQQIDQTRSSLQLSLNFPSN